MKATRALLAKEIRDLFFSRASLLLLLIVCFIFGYSFYSAVSLYSAASAPAMNNPVYATGFEPVPGVFVPTYGGLFLVFSLFLPFLFIPLLTSEKRLNTLSILLQMPFSLRDVLLAKCAAAVAYLVFIMFLSLPALICWSLWGGHIPRGEIALLLTGHFFYGLLVICLSLFSAAIFDSTASASIFAIVAVISSWFIDFGKEMNIAPWLLFLSGWTLTATMKYFEDGIFSLRATAYLALLSGGFLAASYVLLRHDIKSKWMPLVMAGVATAALIWLASLVIINKDMTESRRNSFPPHITDAIKKIPALEIDVFMERTDSRFKDYERSFLKRLLLVKGDVKVELMKGEALKDSYGLYVYKVADKSDKTYSNSEEEIFPILFSLSGITPEKPANEQDYAGYPLVTSGKQQSIVMYIYFLALPLALLFVFTIRHLVVIRRYCR